MQIPPQLPFILSTSDLYLTPIYIIILFFLVKKLRNKYYSESPLRVFILPAFFVHVIGCIFFATIYQFYYGYGDTYGYFTGAHEAWEAFIKDPGIAFELIFKPREHFSQTALDWAPYSSFTGFANSLSVIVKIASFAGLFCFGSYMPIALVFASFSMWGTWLIYVTINKYFPHLYKFTAVACLFIPSVIIWSSGITKEPPCMLAIGLLFFSFDKILHHHKVIKNLLLLITGALVLYYVKSYILYTFLLAASVWGYCFFVGHLNNFFFKLTARTFFFLLLLGFFIYLLAVPENFIQESLKQNLSTGENLQEFMTSVNSSSGGSGYILPELNLSFGGILKSYFLSLNVTLFRPYIWECSNVLMLMSFIESFATLLLVLMVLFKVGIGKIIHYCKMPIMLFMLVFSLILAPIVGFISFNFGTLVRYKIPFLPFFILFFVIILFDQKANEIAIKNYKKISSKTEKV